MSRRLIVVFAILALCLASAGAYAYFMKKSDSNTSGRPVNSVDYSAPSDREKTETEAFKKAQQAVTVVKPEPGEDGKISVKPVISYVGQYDASVESSAYIPGVFENGGTCKLVLENSSSATVIKTGNAVADAQNTRCELFTFAAKELNPGTWSARIDYESSASRGSSTKMEFKVQ